MLGRWAKIRDEFSLVSNTTTQQRRCNGKPYVTESFAPPPPTHTHTHTYSRTRLFARFHPFRQVCNRRSIISAFRYIFFAGRLREGFQTTYNLFACLNYRGYVNNYASRVLFGIII